MVRIKPRMCASAIIATFATISCESGDPAPIELLERHIQVRGGRSAFERLQYVERSGTFHSHAHDLSGSYHTCVKYPDAVAISIDAGPIQLHQILFDDVALECQTAFGSCRVAPERIHEKLSRTAQTANREELFEEVPTAESVEWIQREEEVTGYRFSDNGVISERLFDLETGLLSRKRIGARTRDYSGWETVGPIMLPMIYEDYERGSRTTTVSLDWANVMNQPSPWCESAFSRNWDELVAEPMDSS